LVVACDLANARPAFAQASFQGLGHLPGGGSFTYSDAWGVSADGSVAVGNSSSVSGEQAFRWTQATGMAGLGHLPGGSYSVANGVAANGSVVVGAGSSVNAQYYEAFRWTARGGMTGLGDLPGAGFDSVATGVSADGSIVVGYGTSVNGFEASRWTQATRCAVAVVVLLTACSTSAGTSDPAVEIAGSGWSAPVVEMAGFEPASAIERARFT